MSKELIKRLEALEAEAQARIKELEDALRFYAENEPKVYVIDRPENFGELYFEFYEDDGYDVPFGTIARKALEKVPTEADRKNEFVSVFDSFPAEVLEDAMNW